MPYIRDKLQIWRVEYYAHRWLCYRSWHIIITIVARLFCRCDKGYTSADGIELYIIRPMLIKNSLKLCAMESGSVFPFCEIWLLLVTGAYSVMPHIFFTFSYDSLVENHNGFSLRYSEVFGGNACNSCMSWCCLVMDSSLTSYRVCSYA